MMDHRQYIEQYLSADVDGALDSDEREAVSAHLSGCAECRQRQADERELKAWLRQRIPIVSMPDNVRRKIFAALDMQDAREDVRPAIRPARFSRRPLLLGSLGALAAAAAVLVIILVGGLGQRKSNGGLEAAANDYLSAERGFTSNSALSSPADLAVALTSEFGYPFVWDFSSVGLTMAGARIEHRPDGRTIAYSWYKGKPGSVLCINFRQLDYAVPAGGEEVHGVRFYNYRGLWIGVVNYGSVFCYFVTRLTPQQLMPVLIRNGPKLGV
ncbi:MAG TPA: zf-HC2 domain-containing protein [Candidatus Binataceae bacterium]|jgi:hypothetical protein|nr:zf-HC2 domain-containing protein [Candidatus Binataceae bacterium]